MVRTTSLQQRVRRTSNQALEFGVEIGEYRGVVRVPRRLGAPSGVLGKVGEIGLEHPMRSILPGATALLLFGSAVAEPADPTQLAETAA